MSIEKKEIHEELHEDISAILASDDDAEIKHYLSKLHPADIADLLESIPPEKRSRVFANVSYDQIGEVLIEVSEGVRSNLVDALDSKSLVAAAKNLDTDDIADLIPNLPDSVIAEMLSAMDKQNRQRLDSVLSYPEDTAGGLMNVDTITVRANISLDVVLRYLRRRGELPQDTNKLFVVDKEDKLLGTIMLSSILTAEPGRRVFDLMDKDPMKFNALTDEKEVAAAFERYDLVSAAVVDENNKLIGRITIDDVVDVILEEADHTVMARAGLSEEEDLFAPIRTSTKSRSVWLGVNLITAIIASWVIGQFEDTMKTIIALAVLMPIVASMGGNAGTQTLTLVIRGMALGTITSANARRVLIRELMISVLNSMIWALMVAVVAVVWYQDIRLGMVIAMAMSINLVFAALFGVTIPIFVRRLGIDPALASGVVLTTVTDVVGFLSFLGLAALFLIGK